MRSGLGPLLKWAIVMVSAAIVFLLCLCFFTRYEGIEKSDVARWKAQAIYNACWHYFVEAKSYPDELADLLDDPPYLEGGPKALIDPWGNSYRYELHTDANGESYPFIWTEYTENDRKKIIGWPPQVEPQNR
jgi:hypothetical protein